MASDHEFLLAIGKLAETVLGEGPGPDNHAHQQRAIQALVRMGKPARVRRWLGSVAACLAVAGLTFLGLVLFERSDLRFWVGSAEDPGRLGELLVADAEPMALRFDDETCLELGPTTNGRVMADADSRVRLVMGPGQVRARVNKRTRRRWTVEAGPYLVTAVGTRFSVDWQIEGQCLEVRVQQGTVNVAGTGLGAEGRRLGAGQRLQRCADRVQADARGGGTNDGVMGVAPSDDEPVAEPMVGPEAVPRPGPALF